MIFSSSEEADFFLLFYLKIYSNLSHHSISHKIFFYLLLILKKI